MKFPSHLTIVVSPNDIEHGERVNCFKCPIALAVAALFPGAFVAVNMHGVGISYDRFVATYAATPEIQEWYRAFDGGRTLAATSFVTPLREAYSE